MNSIHWKVVFSTHFILTKILHSRFIWYWWISSVTSTRWSWHKTRRNVILLNIFQKMRSCSCVATPVQMFCLLMKIINYIASSDCRVTVVFNLQTKRWIDTNVDTIEYHEIPKLIPSSNFIHCRSITQARFPDRSKVYSKRLDFTSR